MQSSELITTHCKLPSPSQHPAEVRGERRGEERRGEEMSHGAIVLCSHSSHWITAEQCTRVPGSVLRPVCFSPSRRLKTFPHLTHVAT